MPSNFSPDFYESILEASDRGELWGIENSDLTPLEVQLILSHDFSCIQASLLVPKIVLYVVYVDYCLILSINIRFCSGPYYFSYINFTRRSSSFRTYSEEQ